MVERRWLNNSRESVIVWSMPGWTRLLFLTAISLAPLAPLAGCGTPPPPTACNPSCREGFTCVAGACVNACNPACASGERCDTSGGRARCVAGDGGSDAGPDGATVDTGVATDSSVDTGIADGDTPDTSVSMDSGTSVDSGGLDASSGDTGVSMDGARTDTGVADSRLSDSAVDSPDARTPCGMPGQRCCERWCAYGSTCEVPTGATTGTCQAFMPVSGECVGPTTCAAGNARCRVGLVCGDRRCIQCIANPVGATRRIGEACTNTDECETGFCFGSKCSVLCNLGPAGDSTCAALIPGGVCGGGTSSLMVAAGDAGPARSSVLSFGACRRGCQREADCATGDVCSPATNDGLDRLDFVCRTPTAGLLPGGAACTSNAQCASSVCINLGGATNVCFRPCMTAADCPAVASMCVDMSWIRPAGGLQPGRACSPR